jgi:hypothetical protein
MRKWWKEYKIGFLAGAMREWDFMVKKNIGGLAKRYKRKYRWAGKKV